MILTPESTVIIVACFVVFCISAGANVAAALLMRLLAVILAMFGVDVEE